MSDDHERVQNAAKTATSVKDLVVLGGVLFVGGGLLFSSLSALWSTPTDVAALQKDVAVLAERVASLESKPTVLTTDRVNIVDAGDGTFIRWGIKPEQIGFAVQAQEATNFMLQKVNP